MATSSLEVLFSPAEFRVLPQRDLSQTVCVVFDILRATSTIMTALANGARRVIPVAEIPEAVHWRKVQPDVLLAGEREGLRILASQSGGVDFDCGNSPREFTRSKVDTREIVLSTTNGTRALRACAGAEAVLIGSFLGLTALVRRLRAWRPAQLLLVGAGTIEQASYEDTLAAGAVCDAIWDCYDLGQIADSAAIARHVYQTSAADLPAAASFARNGRRLLANPDLREDVDYCFRRDVVDFVAVMTPQGTVEKASD